MASVFCIMNREGQGKRWLRLCFDGAERGLVELAEKPISTTNI